MPYVHIQVTREGVTPAQKAVLIQQTTDMLRQVLNKDPATTFVVIEEVDTDNWGVAGESVTVRRARASEAGRREARRPKSTQTRCWNSSSAAVSWSATRHKLPSGLEKALKKRSRRVAALRGAPPGATEVRTWLPTSERQERPQN